MASLQIHCPISRGVASRTFFLIVPWRSSETSMVGQCPVDDRFPSCRTNGKTLFCRHGCSASWGPFGRLVKEFAKGCKRNTAPDRLHLPVGLLANAPGSQLLESRSEGADCLAGESIRRTPPHCGRSSSGTLRIEESTDGRLRADQARTGIPLVVFEAISREPT